MRSGQASQGEESEAKTSGHRTKRKDRRLAADQPRSGPEEKSISENPKSPNGNEKNEKLAKDSLILPSGKLIDSESVVGGFSKNSTDLGKSRGATFGGEDDFIPFDQSYSSEEEERVERPTTDPKGKGKAVEHEERASNMGREGREKDGKRRDVDPPPWRSEREWDKGKYQRDWDDDRRQPGSRRDGDRDRDRDGNRKRKYDEHQGDDRDRNTRQRSTAPNKCPWMMGIDLEKCRNVAEMLHCEVESFVDWISPTPVEDEIRGLVVDHIARTLKGPFPDAEVYPFGSYLTKLYLPTGDIDLVVLSDTMAHNDKANVLHIMATTLKRSGITSHVTIIAKAKVPIIKFISAHGRFQVDISINQNNGLFSGNIITGFLKQMVPSANETESKALRSLIMITKAFLAQRNLNEVYTGGLGSYSVVCLAVSFLQMHPKIRNGEIDPEKNLGVLVVEFFELYGNRFNYDNVGISLRGGGTYFNKRERGWTDFKKNMICIEDPADPSNDISSGSYNFHKVRMAFAGAYNLLTTTSYHHAGILDSRHQGTSFRLRHRYEPEDLSVLSTVMGVTQETINHRRLVQELYDKKTVHRMLGVEPRISVVQHASVEERQPSGKKLSTAPHNSRVVESAWTNGRLKDESEDDDNGHRRHSNSNDHDGGKYDISRHTSKKRRRSQKFEDRPVYFVADGDSRLSEGELEEFDDASERYEDDGGRSRQANGMSRDTRRDFWLGKAMKVGLADA